ncbi:MAG: DUF998 domain-containing protein [Methanoregulaceae archaeon]|nr:DUF998 domain-containing protein [Methanoregulaceae archaeon]
MRRIQSPCLTLVAAACGVVAPVLFGSTVLVVGLATPGYNPVTQLISELGIPGAPYPAAINSLGLITTGILLAVFAYAVHAIFSRGWKGALGSALVLVAGLSFVAMGVYHCDQGCIPITPAGSLHLLFGLVALVAGLTAALLLSLVIARESDWNGYWQYSLATGILILVMMPLFLIETESAGLLQRILVGLIFLWTEVLAIRILFISQGLPKEQE